MSATIGSWWLSSTNALPGEQVLFSKAANRTQSSGRAVGGKLFVTNLRIIFLPHLADAALAGEKLLLPLAEVRDVGQQPAGGDTFGGGLRNRLRIVHSGGTELFVVNKLQTVVETIRQLCAPATVGQAQAYPAPGPAVAPTSRRGRWVRIAAIGALAVGVTGYRVYQDVHPGHEFTPVSSASQTADTTCPVAGAETLTMTKNGASEPAIHVPATPGWQEHDFRNDPKIEKNPMFPYLRGVIVNTDLRENGYTPGIEVVLEEATDPAASTREIADSVFEGLKRTAGSVSESTETICGTTVYRADFTGLKASDDMTESGTTLVAVSDVRNGSRWIAGVRLSTDNTDNPEYIAERDALLKGFHVSFP